MGHMHGQTSLVVDVSSSVRFLYLGFYNRGFLRWRCDV